MERSRYVTVPVFIEARHPPAQPAPAMLTVYQVPYSPYAIPLTAALTALGVKHRVKNLPPADRSEVIKLTRGAYYAVPVVQDGKRVVYESRPESVDIARYLDRVYGGGRLFPPALAGLQTILVRYLENDVEGVTFRLNDPGYIRRLPDLVQRVGLIRFKERKFGRGCVEAWAKNAGELLAQATELLQPFEQMLGENPFLLGDAPVYTDFALLGILGNLTYSGDHRIPAKLKRIIAWEKRLRAFRY
jgi:glutathione S-transferase